MEADIEWWTERLDSIGDLDQNGLGRAKGCAQKRLDAARRQLGKREGEGSSEADLVKVLAALRLMSEVRICEIDLLSTEAQESRRESVLIDAKERIQGWQAPAISRILEQECGPSLGDRLKEALRIYYDYEFHLYNRKLVVRDQLKIILASLLVGIVGMIITIGIMWRQDIFLLTPMIIQDEATSDLERRGADFFVAWACFIAGGIGACLSSLITMTSGKYDPDINASRAVTVARPFIGASAGLVVFLFVLAGVLPLGQGVIAAIISVAVAAGFSERLLLGTFAQANPGQQPIA